MATISVIIPAYNSESSLAACLDSVLAQGFTDFEVLAVDDGSTDGTAALISRYAEQDGRVVAISKANGGVSSARNAGLDRAGGEYVCFVDADDTVEEGYLQGLLDAMGEADLAVCGIFRGSEEKWVSLSPPQATVKLEDFKKDITTYGFYLIQNPPWNKLYKRELIEAHHLRFDEKMTCMSDHRFNLEYLPHCSMIAMTSARLYHYYIIRGSITRRFNPDFCPSNKALAQLTLNFYEPSPEADKANYLFDKWRYAIARTMRTSKDPEVRKQIRREVLSDPFYRQSLEGMRRGTPKMKLKRLLMLSRCLPWWLG